MPREPKRSNLPEGNNPEQRRMPDSEQLDQIVWEEQPNQIIWEDSEDVYKPIPKEISQFIAERDIQEKPKRSRRVYIKQDALDDLEKHLESNLQVEQGGILLGNAYSDSRIGTYVEITAAVAAPATVGTSAHLDFTSDSWQGIMESAKSVYPDDNIVGWYHSHPNIGVFMSGTDMNTQQAFFHHPWCLSIVGDPVRKKIGYFLGERAERVKPVIFQKQQQERQIHQAEQQQEPNDNTENEGDKQAEIPVSSSIVLVKARVPRIRIALKKIYRHLFEKKNIKLFLLGAFFLLSFLALPNLIGKVGRFPHQNTPLNYPFKVDTMSWPLSTFEILKSDLPIVTVDKEIGSGDRVTLLVIESQEQLKNVSLEVEILNLNEELEVSPDAKTFLKKLIGEISSQNKRQITLRLLRETKVVLVPLYSSYTGNTVDSKQVVRDFVYIPSKIAYQNKNKNQQFVKIGDILK